MFSPCNNTPRYKEHVIYFIAFEFVEGVTIIDWVSDMKTYVPEMME